ncbi:MAG: hypothetical protein ACRCXB_34675 [Aeromonadaceae bacterium]
MTDKELLEMAAKAAGLDGECHLLTGDCSDHEEPGGFRYEHPDGGHDWWNPLIDDGDALRLAVKLNLLYGKVFARGVAESHEDGDDIYAVTRRAIVLSAAQIGKDMQ